MRKEARNFLQAVLFSAVSSFPVPRIHLSPVEIGLLETTVNADVLSHDKGTIDDNIKDLCLGVVSIEFSRVTGTQSVIFLGYPNYFQRNTGTVATVYDHLTVLLGDT